MTVQASDARPMKSSLSAELIRKQFDLDAKDGYQGRKSRNVIKPPQLETGITAAKKAFNHTFSAPASAGLYSPGLGITEPQPVVTSTISYGGIP
jgi:hypothetical protein